jgi:hypothetical protein
MHPRTGLAALRVSFSSFPVFSVRLIVIAEKYQSRTRSRLTIQPFLLCGSVLHLGRLYTSAARACFGRRETQAG